MNDNDILTELKSLSCIESMSILEQLKKIEEDSSKDSKELLELKKYWINNPQIHDEFWKMVDM